MVDVIVIEKTDDDKYSVKADKTNVGNFEAPQAVLKVIEKLKEQEPDLQKNLLKILT